MGGDVVRGTDSRVKSSMASGRGGGGGGSGSGSGSSGIG